MTNLKYRHFCAFVAIALFGNPFFSKGQTILNADGPGNTIELINNVFAQGHASVEDAECAHPAFGRHIAEVFDADLNKYVFEFYIHVTPDNDRCIVTTTDRQRVEIKTYEASSANLKGTVGETVTYKWRFKIPVGFQPSANFTHIHQVKAVDGDDDDPIFTLTLRKGSTNKLELNYVKESALSANKYRNIDLSLFEGNWVEATETIKVATAGTYAITIKRVDNGATLLSYSNSNISTIRLGIEGLGDNSFIRPKWGIYRSLLDQASLRDDSIRFSDFSISEATLGTEDFPLSSDEMVLYPNPVHDYLEISEKIKSNCDGINIFDTNGKLIVSQKLSSDKLNVSSLSPGLYFVKFLSKGLESKTVKILKK